MHNADILALAKLRVDGRRPEELRGIRYQFNVLQGRNSDGSAYYEQVIHHYFINLLLFYFITLLLYYFVSLLLYWYLIH
jgi:hypothetical protein